MRQILDSLKARLIRRSYWTLKYMDGTTISEQEMDWSEAPWEGRQSVRLYCPNGQVAELGSTNATYRLFQLKVATVSLGQDRNTIAHVIGHVESLDGTCRYAAWEYEQGRLVTGRDNVKNMQYQQIGKISLAPMGMKLDNG